MTQSIEGRFFIVGCPRSGTTLLQSLLAAHPKITSFPESKFFTRLVPTYEPKRRAIGLASARAKGNLEDFLKEIDQPKMLRILPVIPQFVDQYARRFINILDRLTLDRGKTIWLEKTPEHLHWLDCIERTVPQPKIIHIVRNGTDVVASIYELSQKYPKRWGKCAKGLDDCIDRWISDVEISRSYANQPNHSLVRYEDLIENPRIVLKHLCHSLEIDFDAKMLQDYGTTSKQLIRDRETWKAGVSGTIQNNTSHKFYRVFDGTQQQYIFNRLSKIDLDIFSIPKTADVASVKTSENA